MLLVENIIGDLLVQHNCVVVPNFGGFVAQRVAAQFDTKNGVILPPRKSVLFNRQLITNDGLLSAAYAQQSKVSYEEAQLVIAQTIENWGKALKDGKRIAIDRVGILFADKERNICFEQDRFYNLLLSSFGLGSIHFISAADLDAKETREAVQILVKQVEQSPTEFQAPILEFSQEQVVPVLEVVSENPISPILPIQSKQTAWKYVAAAACIPLAFYSFWIPMKTDVLESGVLTLHDFNPFNKKQITHYHAPVKAYRFSVKNQKKQLESIPENATFFSYELSDDHYVPVRIENNNPVSPSNSVETIPEIEIATPKTISSSGVKGSFIIVGSFASQENATNLCTSLKAKGFNAQLLVDGDKIRVSAGKANEFDQIASQLRAEGLSPWVLN